MIKSRKVIIENTVKKIFGEQIILNFSSRQFTKTNSSSTSETTKNDVKNLKPIKKIEPKNDLSKEISKEEIYNNSPKNLANFFNGEIIELDE